MRALVWFRTDLRTRDNTALFRATERATRGVVALYVVSPGEWRSHDEAACKVELWMRSLVELSGALEKLNIALVIERAEAAEDVPGVVAEAAERHACNALFMNTQHEVDEQARDARVAALFTASGREAHAFHDQCILPPGDVRTKDGGLYTVFTPFRRAWIEALRDRGGAPPQGPPKRQPETVGRPSQIPERVDGFSSEIDPALWPAGEEAASSALAAFVENRILDYKNQRDLPGVAGTSRLSPHLACGSISARRCLATAIDANNGRVTGGRKGADAWISELIWREFYRHLLVGFPRVSKGRAFRGAGANIRWRDDGEGLARWQRGVTGYPIVDAGMRQLRATGWMHNRLRMITAMFLTKHLLIDWRLGERFFMQNLIDGDLASNNGGWQWSASTSADAAPYFRIFNPTSQSRRFDPTGAYVRRWVPELRRLDDRAVHDPASAPAPARGRIDYPPPIVDHRAARRRALEAFRKPRG